MDRSLVVVFGGGKSRLTVTLRSTTIIERTAMTVVNVQWGCLSQRVGPLLLLLDESTVASMESLP